jgi:putative hemolysin
VQIGITLIGILAGAYSGTIFGAMSAEWLEWHGLSPATAEPLGFGLVVALITYLSLIVGELVPKRLALRNAEAVACAVAPAMTVMSRVASPLVSFLDVSTRAVLGLFGVAGRPESRVTEEEIKSLIAEAESSGVLEADEQRLMEGVLRLGDRSVKAIMTPRTEVSWIDITADEAAVCKVLIETPHALHPVGEGSADRMIGVVQARQLLAASLLGRPLDIRSLMRTAPIIPDSMDALDVMIRLRDAEVKMALVHDEYGNFEGLVTPADLLETMAGFNAGTDAGEPKFVLREDGSWLLAGWMAADEMADLLDIVLPEHRDYQTVAGFVLQHLQRLPKLGEATLASGWEFEVIDLDGRRIDKVLARRLPPTSRAAAGGGAV